MTKDGIDFGDDFLEGSPIVDNLDPKPEGSEEKEPVKKGRPAKAALVDDEPPIKKEEEQEEEEEEEPVKPKGKAAPETKEDDEPEADDDGLILSLASKLGYEFGEDEEYEDSEEGLVQFIQKQQEIGAQEIVNNYFSNVHPKAGELFDLVNLVSDLPEDEQEQIIEEFFKGKSPELDYNAIDLKDENTQKSVLRTFYRANGFSDDQISRKLDKFEIAGMLEEEAEEAASLLAKAQEQESARIIQQQKQEAAARRRQSEAYYSNLRQTLESGKVGNFNIPVSERKATFDYIAKGDALSKLNELWATPEGRIQLSILLKNDFKLDKYINQAATTKTVSNLRNKLKAGAAKMKSSDPRSNSYDNDWDDGQVSFAKK
jgi:hypothetical protein